MKITSVQMSQFQTLMNGLVASWDKIKPLETSWVAIHKDTMSAGFKFLAGGIDQLVNLAQTFALDGVDKKSLVLQYANQLFDIIVAAEIPVWAKPAFIPLKTMFDAAVDGLIEFAVSKIVAVVPTPTPVVPTPVIPTPATPA